MLSTAAPTPVSLRVSSTTYSAADILVEYRSGAPQPVLPGATVGPRLDNNLYEINLSQGVTVAQALAAYKASADVVLAEPDYTLSATTIATSSTNVSQQWALTAVHAPQAWNNTAGSPSVVVAVADTGVDYTHSDLYQNIWINQAAIPASRLKNLVDVYHDGFISMRDLNSPVNQGSGKIEDLNHNGYIDAGDLLQPMVLNAQGQDAGTGGWVNSHVVDSADGLVGDLIGWNFSAGTDNPYDNQGHGTHVAGLIGATGNNGGTLGVDPNVRLMPIKFLDSNGHGSISQYIEGLDYAVEHGAKIINNSWTGADPSQALIDAIANAQARGVIFVAAAGNDGNNNDASPVYPASFHATLSNVVSVAATDSNNQLAGFTNYGARSVSLAAPGVGLRSTVPGGYADDSGTSMAAPIVSGVLALVWSEHPDWSYTQVINRVTSTVDRVPGLTGKVAAGGVVDAAAAVGAIAASSTPPRVVSATGSGPNAYSLSSIQVTFDRAINPSTFNADDLGLVGPSGQQVAFASVKPTDATDRVFTITFATQTAAGSYTLYVGSNAKDMNGNRVTAYQTSFQVVAAPKPVTPPHVVSTTGSGPNAYSLSSIQVTFDRAINPSTFNADDLGLVGPSGQQVAVASVKPTDATDRTFTITFATQTAAGSYTLYVGPNAKDMNGNRVTAYQTSFKVVAKPATPPHVVSATGSGPNAYSLSTISVTFDRAINPATFNADDLGLIGPAGQQVAVASVKPTDATDRTFTITFATQTTAGSYTLYVGPNAKDMNGNRLTVYQTSFKVVAAPAPPHVVSSTGSGPNAYSLSSIQVTFDRAINPSTFNADDLGLIGPAGQQVAVASVKPTDATDRVFTITFATQTAAGSYTLYVGSNAKDMNGNRLAAYQTSFKVVAAPKPITPPHVVSSTGSGPNAYSLSSISVTFDRAINPSTFTPDDLGLFGPAGQKISVSSVAPTDATDRTFTIRFATQTAAGSYTLYVGPNAKDMAGNRVAGYQSSFKVVQAPPPTTPKFTGGTFTSSTQGAIQAGGRVVSLLTIGQDAVVGSVRVTVNIKYPKVSDLYIHLQGPDGKDVVLFNQNGGNSANLLNTTFDDKAVMSLSFSAGPYSNLSLQPMRPLSPFAGIQLAGSWKLWIEDRGTGNTSGTLMNWSLSVTPR